MLTTLRLRLGERFRIRLHKPIHLYTIRKRRQKYVDSIAKSSSPSHSLSRCWAWNFQLDGRTGEYFRRLSCQWNWMDMVIVCTTLW